MDTSDLANVSITRDTAGHYIVSIRAILTANIWPHLRTYDTIRQLITTTYPEIFQSVLLTADTTTSATSFMVLFTHLFADLGISQRYTSGRIHVNRAEDDKQTIFDIQPLTDISLAAVLPEVELAPFEFMRFEFDRLDNDDVCMDMSGKFAPLLGKKIKVAQDIIISCLVQLVQRALVRIGKQKGGQLQTKPL